MKRNRNGESIWIHNGIDDARVGESEDALLRWDVAPLAGGLLVIIVTVSASGLVSAKSP